MKIDEIIVNIRAGRYLTERELKILCEKVKELLVEESNIQPVFTPITVCGDIHGQFYDLLELFNKGGEIPDTSYIFIGDIVDRGYHSVESLQLLLCLKVKYPGRITLIRGNHESRTLTQTYGFYDEILRKYGNSHPWKYCTEVFDLLPIGAIIDGTILCIHGGLSPQLVTIDQFRSIERRQEIPQDGALGKHPK